MTADQAQEAVASKTLTVPQMQRILSEPPLTHKELLRELLLSKAAAEAEAAAEAGASAEANAAAAAKAAAETKAAAASQAADEAKTAAAEANTIGRAIKLLAYLMPFLLLT